MSDIRLGGIPPAIMAKTTHAFTLSFIWVDMQVVKAGGP